jgi:hypothetical protein
MSGSLEFLWLIDDSSNNVMYCDVCRKAGPDITGKTCIYSWIIINALNESEDA